IAMHKMRNEVAYAKFLSKNRDEAEALGEDILIHVTEFFRDAHFYAALRAKVFPKIINKRAPEKAIRIWVPGCSTGEEVYSIAIELMEYMRTKRLSHPVQIFGTDVSDIALQRARHGIYDERIVSRMPAEYIKRYFVKGEGKSWQINKAIRDICIFAKHN